MIVNIKKRILSLKSILLKRMSMIGILDEKNYLKKVYKLKMGRKLNLENPVTYNEKMQWLKLYDRKEIYTTMVDKYLVKEHVSKIIGEKHIIPTIGVFDKFDDINFNLLPNKFVIKCNHDSGSVIVCRNKNIFNKKAARKKINRRLKKNYYDLFKEWPYKNVKPKIIVEEYLEDSVHSKMKDYKFFCFNGNVEFLYVSEDFENHNPSGISFFDKDFNLINCSRKDFKPFDYIPDKPKNFDKMKKYASILSNGIPHIRVDFYEVNGNLYFSELTFFTCGGYIPFEDDRWDYEFGKFVDLPLDNQ